MNLARWKAPVELLKAGKYFGKLLHCDDKICENYCLSCGKFKGKCTHFYCIGRQRVKAVVNGLERVFDK